jgi:hypothetical protein
MSSALVLLVLAGAARAAETGWESLFDGKSLRGWKASESPASFKVVDGTIVADGPRAHLFYLGEDGNADFKNFEFTADVKTQPGANSGIYFHTKFQATGFPDAGFEAQVNNSATQHGDYLELKKTGSLYTVRNIHRAVARDGEWFTMKISVRGRRIQIRVDDVLLVDYVEPQPPVLDPKRPGRRLGHGTFALQGHDPESKVAYRNLRVKRLPEDLVEPVEPVVVDDVYRQIIKLGSDNFPLIDLHTHLKGGLTLDEVQAHMRQTGINHGIAVNGGLGFAVTNDAGIDAFLQSVRGAPCFIGLQAEGREWPRLFSRESLRKFDYVFTDAMTLTDQRGQRSRLWIPEEVSVPDKQAFMEMLVSNIVTILDHEPIDIYVNPTYLPEVIAADYDALWTPERMGRVIAAAKRNGVAVEINSRFKLPSAAFIQRAKKAGVKFTLGTNNGGRDDLGRLEYSLRMVQECGLSWKDMWVPGAGSRAKRDAGR